MPTLSPIPAPIPTSTSASPISSPPPSPTKPPTPSPLSPAQVARAISPTRPLSTAPESLKGRAAAAFDQGGSAPPSPTKIAGSLLGLPTAAQLPSADLSQISPFLRASSASPPPTKRPMISPGSPMDVTPAAASPASPPVTLRETASTQQELMTQERRPSVANALFGSLPAAPPQAAPLFFLKPLQPSRAVLTGRVSPDARVNLHTQRVFESILGGDGLVGAALPTNPNCVGNLGMGACSITRGDLSTCGCEPLGRHRETGKEFQLKYEKTAAISAARILRAKYKPFQTSSFTLVLFGSGGLFGEQALVMKLMQECAKVDGSLQLELVLIDLCYGKDHMRFSDSQDAIEQCRKELGQLQGIYELVQGMKIKYRAYSSGADYIQDVKNGHAPPHDLVVGCDIEYSKSEPYLREVVAETHLVPTEPAIVLRKVASTSQGKGYDPEIITVPAKGDHTVIYPEKADDSDWSFEDF